MCTVLSIVGLGLSTWMEMESTNIAFLLSHRPQTFAFNEEQCKKIEL